MPINASTLTSRYVSSFGETLVVRDHCGTKVLTDPIDENTAVVVPPGRRARLVRFIFGEPARRCGRDPHVIVIARDCRLGFAHAEYPKLWVSLDDLPIGQLVDILPVADPAAAYAALPRPLPVFHGAVAAQLTYAASAA